MSKAMELAKEISTAVLAKVALNYKTATIQQMNDMVASVIAAKLEQYAIFDKPTGNIPQISSWSG